MERHRIPQITLLMWMDTPKSCVNFLGSYGSLKQNRYRRSHDFSSVPGDKWVTCADKRATGREFVDTGVTAISLGGFKWKEEKGKRRKEKGEGGIGLRTLF